MKNKINKKQQRNRKSVRLLHRIFRRKKTAAAVIVAAGSSTRMGGDKSKQLLCVDGLPVIVRSAAAFDAVDGIGYVIVVARPCDAEEIKALLTAHGIKKVRAIVPGGETRRESVLRGVEALDADTDFVAIHDGARCLVTPKMINEVLDTAKRTGAASAGTPVRDTIKQVSFWNVVESTPDRDKLWAAQTPQIFSAGLYRAAAYYADKDGAEVTDDNSILERLGGKVTMVDCGPTNVKVTSPEDIAVAEALLKYRTETEREDIEK